MRSIKCACLPAVAILLAAAVPLTAYAEGQPPPGAQLEYLMDRAAVETLLAKYARAADFGTLDDYVALFTKDAVIHRRGMDYEGQEAIRKLSAPVFANRTDDATPPHSRHVLSNADIELDGDTGTVFESWMTIVGDKNGAPVIGGIGHYKDTVVKVNGQWLFSRREIDVDIAAPPAK